MRKIHCLIRLFILIFVAFLAHQSASALSPDLNRRLIEEVNEFIQSENVIDDETTSNIVDFKHAEVVEYKKLYCALQKFGKGLFYSGRQALAVKYYRLLLNFFESAPDKASDDVAFLLDIYICLGASLEEIGMRNISMEYYMKGVEAAGEGDFENYRAMLLNNIGVIYLQIGADDRALKYFSDAIEINERLNIKNELFINYNNLSAVYARKNDYAKALDCALKSLQYVDHENDPASYYSTHINLGILNNKEGRYSMAVSYLSNAVNQLGKLGFTQALIDANIALADVFAKMEQPDSARCYNAEALRLAHELGNASQRSKALEQSSRIAAQSHQWERSSRLLAEAYSIRDSLQDADNQQRIAQWEAIYNLRLDEADNQSIISKWDPENVFYVMLCIIAILMCVIAILHMTKARKDSMLRHNKLAYLENQKRSNEMQSTIDLQNRELTTYTLEKLKTNEFINDITEELRGLLREVNPRDREQKSRIQLILKKLLQFGDQDSWKEFQFYFEKVHPQFYEVLDAKYPDLTPKEKRLCAFLYLDLSTKEIASITFREVRSVESSRNRLRKKLNIPQEANLSDYIKAISKS